MNKCLSSELFYSDEICISKLWFTLSALMTLRLVFGADFLCANGVYWNWKESAQFTPLPLFWAMEYCCGPLPPPLS